MATVDPKRAALVRALMERDLYEMLEVAPDAGDEEVLAGIAKRREWVEETPMRAAARDAEMHWLAWAERALVNDPEIRAEYDAALARKAAAQERAVESRQRVRRLRVARDQLARREAERVTPAPAARKAPAPRTRTTPEAPAGAGPEVETEVVEVMEVMEVMETEDAVTVTDVVEVTEVTEVAPEGETPGSEETTS